ncbi:MAG: glycosyltransferase family 2 protein [Candidatus Planktophila sp.]|jgi:glycosyltransferase involved in cell wall biosynthesis|nr:glycosyltransferase family 2 protein [Candidatus Planktophila sp.]
MSTSANELYGSPKREISVILAVRNEGAHLANSVQAILSQDFTGPLEVIVALGPSDDGSEVIAQKLAESDSRITIIASPTGRTAAGLNLALKRSQYSNIVRIDGHAQIPQNYLTLVLETLTQSGAVNVGGVMAADGQSVFERCVARAMRSPLGVGASRFHTGGSAGAVDTVYLGAFRKEALLAVGGFDERFTRAQDWELNFRLRAAGGSIYFDPGLIVSYQPRSTLSALARQYFEYGRWRRVVSRRHQGTINLRYLAPPFTVLVSALSIILGTLVSTIFLLPVLIYALFIVISSVIIGKSLIEVLSLPSILLTMHMCWGLGFLTSPRSLAL